MTFKDTLKRYLNDRPDLCMDKLDAWFTGRHELVADIYARELIPDATIRGKFFSLWDLNERFDVFKDKLTSTDKWNSHYKVLYAKLCKYTLFGLSKYCQESEGWVCQTKGDTVYRFEWFHFVISNEVDWGLMALMNPKILQRNLLTSIPPQHGKSFLLSGMTPAMFLGCLPKEHGILASYSDDMAAEILNRDFIPCVSSIGYSKLFPNNFNANLSEDTKKDWVSQGKKLPRDTINTKETTRGGRVVSRGYIGVTGKRGGFLVLDDPVKDSSVALSQTTMANINKSISSGIKTRGNNRSFLVIVQTRWVFDDPIGVAIELHKKVDRLKESNPKFKKAGKMLVNICFRAFYDTTDDFPYDFRFEKDSMLWESFQGATYLEKMAEDDEMTFNALYQQRPMITRGSNVNRDDFQRYRETPTNISNICISVDPSSKAHSGADRFAIAVWGMSRDNKYYLLDLYYERASFLGGLEAITTMISKYPSYSTILVEEKANGIAIIETLRQKFNRVIAFDPKGDSKLARFKAVTPIIEGKSIYIPDNSWGSGFIDQLVEFTGVGTKEKDDLVDVTSQFLLYFDEQFKAKLRAEDIKIKNTSRLVSLGGGKQVKFSIHNNVLLKNKKSILAKYNGGMKWLG
tara:strand:- start:3045 stop:4934 length:1890 start_codon:yes stop_codon:yes gene_type:complete